jgi:hypothetical protein
LSPRADNAPPTTTVQEVVRLARLLEATHEADERLGIVSELQDLVALALTHGVLEAHRAGHSWRSLGVLLEVPWQTLYRRYGGCDDGPVATTPGDPR